MDNGLVNIILACIIGIALILASPLVRVNVYVDSKPVPQHKSTPTPQHNRLEKVI